MSSKTNVGALSALMCMTSAAAVAQSVSVPQGVPGVGRLEEVVVSARRRAEKIEDVPATIQALDAQTLTVRGIRSESDLQTAIPGLVVRANNNNNQLYYAMRGESMEPYAGTVPGVQPYLNEVALSGNAGVAFYDLDTVQALKGPQGTLFGRNSTGGAVLYKTAAPKNEWGGYGSVEYGRFEKTIVEGAFDSPFADAVLLRVAGTYQSGGAFVTNDYDGREVGDSRVKSGRATLQLSPMLGVANSTLVQYTAVDATNFGDFPTYIEPRGVGARGPGVTCWMSAGNAFFDGLVGSPQGAYFPGWPDGNVYAGGLATLIPYLRSRGRYVMSNNGANVYRTEDTLIANTTSLELSDSLTVKNVFGYNDTRREMSYDNDSTPYPLLTTGGSAPGGSALETRVTHTLSNELQLQGKAFDARLHYIVGAFYADAKVRNNNPVDGLGYIPAFDAFYTFAIRYKSQSEDESRALFTQGTYAVTDRLNVTAGMRYTWDTLSLEQHPDSAFNGVGLAWQRTDQDDKSWTLSLDYRFTDELLAYATTRGSWRVGGYNPFIPPGTTNTQTAAEGGNYFPAEQVRDVELGAKYRGQAGGVPIRIYADVFYAWVENIQKNAFIIVAGQNTSATTSVPKAEVKGIEIDAAIVPTKWLQFGVTYSYVDAEYTDNVAVLFGTVNAFGPFSDTPRHSGTVYADLDHVLPGAAGAIKYHVDAYSQSSTHTSNLGDTFNPHDELPGYTLYNARVEWHEPFGATGLTASVFGKNLGDKYYFVGGGGGIQLFGLNSGVFGPPRTYGVSVRYQF